MKQLPPQTPTDASVLKHALMEQWSRRRKSSNTASDFVFRFRLCGCRKALNLAAGVQRLPRIEKAGITGVGWHTFLELGEHQLTILDYLRHRHFSVTSKHLHAALQMNRNAQARLAKGTVTVHLLRAGKTTEADAH